MSRLELDPPPPGGAIASAADQFALDAPTLARINAVAREFAGGFLAIDAQSPDFDRKTRQIALIGKDEVLGLSAQAQKIIARSGARDSAISAVTTHLSRLRAVLERLNPGNGDELLKPRRLFGIFARRVELGSYFDRYTQSEAEIEAALGALAHGRDTLLLDNIAVAACRTDSWPLLAALGEAIALCTQLDARFEHLARQLEKRDHVKAERLRIAALFEVRQRHGDLLTQMAVSQQSYMMLSLIESNNMELVKGIDRASATTLAALQTAVVAAQTLSNQRIVLDRIWGVQTVGTSMIERASGATAQGNERIALDSAEAAQQVAVLRSEFAEAVASLDSLERQQTSALSAL